MSDESQTGERLVDAFALAEKLHRGQTRNGTEIPYISHLLAVASLVMDNGGDEDQVVAALLHDGPEDQGGRETLEIIRQRFGERVARIVEECTDSFEHPKPAWRVRRERYVAHLAEASPETLLVAVADKAYNLGCIVRDFKTEGNRLWSRFSTGREDIFWYYGALCEAFDGRAELERAPLFAQLRDSFAELNRLTDLAEPLEDGNEEAPLKSTG